MKVEVLGHTYGIQFEHGYVPTLSSDADGFTHNPPKRRRLWGIFDKRTKSSNATVCRATLCRILHLPEENQRINVDNCTLGKDVAACSSDDNFNKETGRKIALTRALKNIPGFTKQARTAFWDVYLHRADKQHAD